LYAVVSGNSALANSVRALNSGNAALEVIVNNPPVNAESLVGLIFALS
jgi:hypothetical protein